MVAADQRSNMAISDQKLLDYIPIQLPEMENVLRDGPSREKRFLDFLKAKPSKEWFHRLGFTGRISPFSFVRRLSSRRDGSTRPPFTLGPRLRRHLRVPFVRRINWPALINYCKEWIKKPTNMALFIWLLAVAGGLLMLLLLSAGFLNGVIPESSRRKEWVETNNQILNALFTIMCLYQHPRLLHHLFLLLRYRSSDVAELRRLYCKYANGRPRERFHLGVVLALLQITCLAQYSLCVLYWGYSRTERSDFGETLCVAVGICAPIVAGLYMVYGPLGRKGDAISDVAGEDEVEGDLEVELIEDKLVVARPQWVGGLFDIWDDMTVAYLSFFCTFCVFGWNMERLGFGNMYVHIATFALLCIAPFLVFNAAGLKFEHHVRETIGIIGILVSFLGLMYGGFWRRQMRRKFRLPASKACFGYAGLTDFMRWLFCWSCALAQEVRTGNFYDVEEDSFYTKRSSSVKEGSVMAPLPREGGGSAALVEEVMAAPVMVVVVEREEEERKRATQEQDKKEVGVERET